MSETPPRETLPPALRTLIDTYGFACAGAGINGPVHVNAARAALESSLGAMVADSARIEWLERQSLRIIQPHGSLSASVRTVRPEGFFVGKTVRDAIDAARSPHAAPSGETRA